MQIKLNHKQYNVKEAKTKTYEKSIVYIQLDIEVVLTYFDKLNLL